MKFETVLAPLAAIVSLWSALPAAAQTATVSVKIDLVAWGESITGLSLKSGNGNTPVTAYAFRYSKPVSYTGPNVLEIYRTPEAGEPAAPAANAGAAAEIPPALAARRKENPNLVSLAVLPTTSKHVTVLLAPAAAGTYQAYVVDDDPAKLPLGQLRIHNLCPLNIAVRCNGDKSGKLLPKQAVVIEPKNREVIYELAYEKDGEWIEQENNIAMVRDDEQAQLVVLQSDASFFTSTDGSKSGYLQTVILRRSQTDYGVLRELTAAEKKALDEQNRKEEAEMEKRATQKPTGTKPSGNKPSGKK